MSFNKNQQYCLYQQRYPIRLPKLVEKGTKKRKPSKDKDTTATAGFFYILILIKVLNLGRAQPQIFDPNT